MFNSVATDDEPPEKVRILQHFRVKSGRKMAQEIAREEVDQSVTVEPTAATNEGKISPPLIPIPSVQMEKSPVLPLPTDDLCGTTQTDLLLSSRTPRKEKFRKSIKMLRNENSYLKMKNQKLSEELELYKKNISDAISLQKYIALTYKFCPSQNLAKFINSQISLSQKESKGRRYSHEFKIHCLAMYFTGPKVYKKKLMAQFCLPSPVTLYRLTKNLNIKPGVNDSLFDMLKKKTDNFSNDDRLCILCFDEMAIKANLFYGTASDSIIGLEDDGTGNKIFKPALTATVFMIRGIKNKWNQPLCYKFFHSTCPGEKLKSTIFEIIIKLKEIGLTVCALISDMGSNNMMLSKILQITPTKPYFTLNNQNIIYMFDTPHLIKAIRNNLLKYNFVTEKGHEVSWKYIEQFYNHDQKYYCELLRS